MTRTDLMKTIRKGGDLTKYDGFTDISENTPTQQKILLEDSTPMIYICATMWHESEQEMIYMLKSIFRFVTLRWLTSLLLSIFPEILISIKSVAGKGLFMVTRSRIPP